MKIGKLANLFPEMTDDEYNDLVISISKYGLLEDITTHNGEIIDGRHRYKACEVAGVLPTYIEYDGDDPLGYVMAKNMDRRHLTVRQKAYIAADIANLTVGSNQHVQTCTPSTQEAANIMGVSKRSVDSAKKVKREDPELFERIKTGEKKATREPIDDSFMAQVARLEARLAKSEDSVKKAILFYLNKEVSTPSGNWAKLIPSKPEIDTDFTKMVCKWQLSRAHPDKGGSSEDFVKMKDLTDTILRTIRG